MRYIMETPSDNGQSNSFQTLYRLARHGPAAVIVGTKEYISRSIKLKYGIERHGARKHGHFGAFHREKLVDLEKRLKNLDWKKIVRREFQKRL